ncbi:MAG: zf-HC2 domain-containing protein, partial [Planctomycetes bacterium]|nr:zf-HC2 domain-containing protein [Planctomycetota bacterium]
MKYTCEQIQEKIVEMMDGNVLETEMEAVDKHLNSCGQCRAYRDAMQGDDKALGEYAASLDDVITNLKNNVNALLGDEDLPVRKIGTRRFGMRIALSITAAAAVIVIVALVSMDHLKPLQKPVKTVASADIEKSTTEIESAKIALEIELPPLMLAGTPKNMSNVENLEKPRA